jgi:hypothetical protein
MVHEGSEPCRLHDDVLLFSQRIAQQRFGHGASADVADADHEYVPDHYRFSGSQLVVVK